MSSVLLDGSRLKRKMALTLYSNMAARSVKGSCNRFRLVGEVEAKAEAEEGRSRATGPQLQVSKPDRLNDTRQASARSVRNVVAPLYSEAVR